MTPMTETEALPTLRQNKTGRFAIIEQFVADGFRFMFGNPGTVEQGFLDALSNYPELRYILTLQESVAVMMADGYARAMQRPALVQIHSTPGLGNSIGALYQAMRGHSPLVVIGGDAGIRYQAMDAQMAGDLVGMARPVTKWATVISDPASTLRLVRRAIKIASTPPMGPVYLCLPMDVLDAPCQEQVRPTDLLCTRAAPDPERLREAAEWLAQARRPMLFVGDGITWSNAQPELVRVAEQLGAEVWEADAGDVNMAQDHPLYRGMTGHMFGSHSLPITRQGDVNLICGTYMLPEVFPELGAIFAPDSKTIHIDLNLYEIGKNHPVDMGLLGDPKQSLGLLHTALQERMTPEESEAAKKRTEILADEKAEQIAQEKQHDAGRRDNVPLTMSRFMEELMAQLPADAILFDEALTNSPPVSRYFSPRPGQYFQTRGGSLGVGVPGAMGAWLAHPDKTVIGFSGDGGSMYTIQALWTAVRHHINAKFVICNNGLYRLLQLNIDQYWQEQEIAKHDFPLCFDLSAPSIRFDELARSVGMQAVRVEKPWEIQGAIQQALAHPGPFLIDLVLEGETHPERIGNTCGQ